MSAQKEMLAANIAANLMHIRSLTAEDLVRSEELGSTLSFQQLAPTIFEVQKAAADLAAIELVKLPVKVLDPIADPLLRIVQTLAQIRSFQPGTIDQRDELASRLEDKWGDIYVTVQAILAAHPKQISGSPIEKLVEQALHSAQQALDASNSVEEFREAAAKQLDSVIEAQRLEFSEKLEADRQAVSDAVDAVRKMAQDAGISSEAIHFRNEAMEHRRVSYYWLGALGVLVLLLVAFSLFANQILHWAGVPTPTTESSNAEVIGFLGQKGLIVFCLVFALLGAARNYGASRHNYVVNKHRANALSSIQAFSVSASADQQTKSAVLIQATQAIFTPQVSGYVKGDGDNSPSTPIIEILRSTGGKES